MYVWEKKYIILHFEYHKFVNVRKEELELVCKQGSQKATV